MSRLTSSHQGLLSGSHAPDWLPSRLSRRVERRDPGTGLMLASLVALGLGVAAFYVLAPDIKRYIKIRNM